MKLENNSFFFLIKFNFLAYFLLQGLEFQVASYIELHPKYEYANDPHFALQYE